MFGAVQFYKACKDAGHQADPRLRGQPVPRPQAQRARDSHHLVLLARGQEGYRNLVQLVEPGLGRRHGARQAAHRLRAARGAPQGPGRADGVHGRLPRAGSAAEGRGRRAATRSARCSDCFEPGAFFVELQDHGFLEQKPLNEILVKLAREIGAAARRQQRLPLPRRKHAQRADGAAVHRGRASASRT